MSGMRSHFSYIRDEQWDELMKDGDISTPDLIEAAKRMKAENTEPRPMHLMFYIDEYGEGFIENPQNKYDRVAQALFNSITSIKMRIHIAEYGPWMRDELDEDDDE